MTRLVQGLHDDGFRRIFSLRSPVKLSAEEQSDISKMVETLKRPENARAVMENMKEHLPNAWKALVYERDIYLVNSINKCPGQTIVAVVGAGHLKGIIDMLVYGEP